MMMRNAAKILLLLIALVIMVVPFAGCDPTSTESTGSPAPDLRLSTLDGQVVSLKDMQDKVVVLNFWATWCPPCRGEMPLLQQVHDEWSKKGVVLLAVDVGESATTVSQFIKANRYTMPVLLDSDGSTGTRWGVAAYPTTFFIDGKGIVRDKVVGAFPNKGQIDSYIKKIIQ